MAEERGGKDGWVVEDCGIASYLLIECSECNISTPQMFYSYSDAVECMLSRLAEVGELDAGQLKKDYSVAKKLFEEDQYGADQDSAWLTDSHMDWQWKIQPVCIYGPMNMVFLEDGEKLP